MWGIGYGNHWSFGRGGGPERPNSEAPLVIVQVSLVLLCCLPFPNFQGFCKDKSLGCLTKVTKAF